MKTVLSLLKVSIIVKTCKYQAFLSQMWVWIQTFFKLVSHYRFIHSHEHGFSLSCLIDGCEKICSKGFLTKTYQEKAQQLLPRTLVQVKGSCKKWYYIKFTCRGTWSCWIWLWSHGEEDIEIGETEIDLKKIGSFLISLRAKYKLPSIVIPQIIS